MTSLTLDTGVPPGVPPFPVHRFTVAEYERLAKSGILHEDSNVELLQGWITPKMPKHPQHDSAIDLIAYLLGRMLPAGWYIRVQNSVVTPDSVPEPDLAVVRGRPGDYKQEHPRGKDVALVIEIADATVSRDRTKAPIYARAGIPHYWIVNLTERQVECHAQPVAIDADHKYAARTVVKGDEALSVILAGQSVGTVKVSEILG